MARNGNKGRKLKSRTVGEHATRYSCTARSKNPVIYHRGDRRGRRVLKRIQSSACSAYSAVKLKDIVVSLKKSIVLSCTYGAVPDERLSTSPGIRWWDQ